MHDIVYILKKDIDNHSEELRYSLRSVEKNFPYQNIWFAGSCPKDIDPDYFLSIKQQGPNKWTKVRNTIEELCRRPELSEDFWLFNDDFFIMQPVKDCPTAIEGTMSIRIKELMWKNNLSKCAKELYITKKLLESKGYDSLNYAMHLPMLINKTKALETLKTFPNCPMFRCCYGNHHSEAKIVIPDVKIYKEDQPPTGNEIYLSTSDESFEKGIVGSYIRNKFKEKSRYET